ncbi:thioesterase family protein [Blastomonas sp.]|uniref:acyl-CoA thioesterase n=1 Tax=Blastomonas sp. TaxID=1909299 RepID=UPI00261DF994|nr:acyl-CoA thioesterase [Blastomonas sp.]MDM7955759.1 acyl-CoA thioesterase [Blastomonas sp.]
MPMIETYRGVAFPWLCDQMGHLTTFRYVEMFDVASYHLMHALGDRPAAQAGELGWADVNHSIDYKSEVAIGALLLIRSGVVRTGRSSIVTRHIMTDPDAGVEHAVLTATTVRFDLVARKSAPLPDLIRAGCEALHIA